MKRWPTLVGLLLLGLSTSAVQRGDTPPKQTIGVTTSTAAGPLTQAKPAWQFTDDERFALRTNPTRAQERVAARRESTATTRARPASADRAPIADSFNGRTHPELFLPTEVFREFITMSFSGEQQGRDIVRHAMAADVARFGLPADFWKRLEALLAFHISDLQAERDLLASLSKVNGAARERLDRSLQMKQDDVCRGRAEGLALARDAFGRERFDRFLYEVVAPNTFYVADKLQTAEQLRWREGGCR